MSICLNPSLMTVPGLLSIITSCSHGLFFSLSLFLFTQVGMDCIMDSAEARSAELTRTTFIKGLWNFPWITCKC